MSSSDSTGIPELDPAIAEAVDGVTNRFGAEGLEQLIAYAETSLTDARAALRALAESVDAAPGPLPGPETGDDAAAHGGTG